MGSGRREDRAVAPVAQWIEQSPSKRLAAGSNPAGGATHRQTTAPIAFRIAAEGLACNLMRVAVTGSHGLIGTALVAALESDHHEVVRLTRGTGEAGSRTWDLAARRIDRVAFEGVNAVVHLAGAGIADHRWTAAHKRDVLDSRVVATTLLAETIATLDQPPTVFASGSAIGFYGDRGDEILDETTGAGSGFLADVVAQWEASTAAAERGSVRVVHLRTGIVLSTKGGALKKQLLPFKLGAGGRFGTGRQFQSWISLADEVRAIRFVIDNAAMRGPVNLTSPNPVTNADFTKALGAAVHRPTVLPTPLFAVKALFSAEMVQEMLLASARVVPRQLISHGFDFLQPDLSTALRSILDTHA